MEVVCEVADPSDETDCFRGVLLNKAVSFASGPVPFVEEAEAAAVDDPAEGAAGGIPEVDEAEVRLAWDAPADNGEGPGKDPLLPSVPMGAI